jgi:hypothetical protein
MNEKEATNAEEWPLKMAARNSDKFGNNLFFVTSRQY